MGLLDVVAIGEWYKIDVYIENHGNYSAQLYINDQFVKAFDRMPGSEGKYVDDYEVSAQFMRVFNHNAGASGLDIYVAEWDVNFNRKMPELPEA